MLLIKGLQLLWIDALQNLFLVAKYKRSRAGNSRPV